MSLLEFEPDLADVLGEEELIAARQFLLPVAAVDKGGDVAQLLAERGAFGAVVLEGMLVQALQISNESTLRLTAPGSFVPAANGPRATPSRGARLFVPVPTRLVLLGGELLVAARRWPWLVSNLHARMLEDSEALATQLAICQLPRVEDRVMSMMRLLAESWGRVTPAGIRLPLSLSHETLGAMVGARRSTVTLALRKLADEGSLIRQGGDWMILEPNAAPVSTDAKAPQLLLTPDASSSWTAHDLVEQGPKTLRALIRQLAQAREESAYARHRARELGEQARDLREHSQRLTDGGT